mgnify:CR=1 FL=1
MLFIEACGGGGGGGPPPTAPGRNDTIATATPLPLGNATFAGSISPSGHPNTVFAPDEDYYRITTQGPLRVAIDINAQVNGSPLDSVIEFVDSSGVVLNSCVAPAFRTTKCWACNSIPSWRYVSTPFSAPPFICTWWIFAAMRGRICSTTW